MLKTTLFSVSAILATIIYIESHEPEKPIPLSPVTTIKLELPPQKSQTSKHTADDKSQQDSDSINTKANKVNKPAASNEHNVS